MEEMVVYSLPGMAFFGEHIAKTLDAPHYCGCMIPDCETVYIIGLYDPPNYDYTWEQTKRAKRRVIHWCGTDVQLLRDDAAMPEATHLCESDNLRRELLAKGIIAEVITFPTHIHPPVTPLPAEPTIAIYVGSDPRKYGADVAQAAIDAIHPDFPSLRVAVYRHGQYDQEQMLDLISQSSVYLRLPKHDGSANSAREFMEAGREVVCTADLPHARVVSRSDFPGLVRALRNALRVTEPDGDVAAYYKEFNSAERYLARLRECGVL